MLYSGELLNGGPSENLEGMYCQLAESTTQRPFYTYNISSVYFIEDNFYRKGERSFSLVVIIWMGSRVWKTFIYIPAPSQRMVINSEYVGKRIKDVFTMNQNNCSKVKSERSLSSLNQIGFFFSYRIQCINF